MDCIKIPVEFFKALEGQPAIFRLMWVQWLARPHLLAVPTFPDKVSYNTVPREKIKECYDFGMRFFGEGFIFTPRDEPAPAPGPQAGKAPDKKHSDERCSEIIEYLNKVTGSKYRLNSESTVKLIVARLDEGYSVEDFKKVIDKKSKRWLGTEHAIYLRPITLFNKTKFENYYNEPDYAERQPNSSIQNVADSVAIAKAKLLDGLRPEQE